MIKKEPHGENLVEAQFWRSVIKTLAFFTSTMKVVYGKEIISELFLKAENIVPLKWTHLKL